MYVANQLGMYIYSLIYMGKVTGWTSRFFANKSRERWWIATKLSDFFFIYMYKTTFHTAYPSNDVVSFSPQH